MLTQLPTTNRQRIDFDAFLLVYVSAYYGRGYSGSVGKIDRNGLVHDSHVKGNSIN